MRFSISIGPGPRSRRAYPTRGNPVQAGSRPAAAHGSAILAAVNDLFLRACRGEATERLPVWIMRQAGRYLPEYRALREKVDFLTLCKTPELAAEVSLQPIRRFGMDACIMFSDILTPVEAMGARIAFTEKGPALEQPVRTIAGVDRLGVPDPPADMPFVLETLRRLRSALHEETA